MSVVRVGNILLAGLAGLALAVVQAAEPTADKDSRIVFSSNRAGPWRIWSIRPDGTDLRQLTQAGADEQDVDPVVSPDRRWLLFTSTRGGATRVWKATIEGSQPTAICEGDQAEWAPDGRQIVLRRGEQIYVHPCDGGAERQISPKDWPHCSGPSWSPDGKQIAFACRWDAGNALFLVAVGGGAPVTVYDKKPACEPHWSPDGLRLVYETKTNICTIGADGKKNRIVTYFGGVQRYGRYSPDGQSIVYCQGASERGPWELFVIPAQGGPPRQFTQGGSDMNPDWR